MSFPVIVSQRVGAKRRPMTGSAKQSTAPCTVLGCFVAAFLAMTVILAVITTSSAPAFAAGPAEMISDFRAKNGEGKVVMDATLNAIAQRQAVAMASKDVLSHEAGGSFTSRVAPANVSRAAENIAYGYPDFPNTLKQWINSPGHRANLLLKGASKVGVASVRSSASGRTYWAMVIAGGDEKPKAKPPAKSAKPAATSAKGADKEEPAKPKSVQPKSVQPKSVQRDCSIKMLGLCF
ncbi:CAP domain-containing protein [Rhodopseudomonas palustris]|uniref:CAP domain-containing protein n=1 Tax=Rhodopseudomonas palustris TaxID=1076 RepID=UPI003B967E5F